MPQPNSFKFDFPSFGDFKKSLRFLKKLRKLSHGPYPIFGSILLGIWLGFANKDIAKSLEFIGKGYVDLLKLCVLPILLSAVIISASRLTQLPNIKSFVIKLVGILIFSQFASGLIGYLIAFTFGPGRNLNQNTLDSLGAQINVSGIDSEINLNKPIAVEKNPLLELFTSAIPSNIFEALAENHSLQVVVFAVTFGVALGLIGNSSAKTRMVQALEEVYDSFRKIVKWVNALLPLGLFSLLSVQIAKTGAATIVIMLKFVAITVSTLVGLYVVSFIILWVRSRASLKKVWSASEEYTLLTMATSNASSSLPSAIQCLVDRLHFDEQLVNAGLPISVIAFRYGNVAYFVIAAVFASQLYNLPIRVDQVLLVVTGAMFAALASAGSSGLATLATLDVVFRPLGLPLDAILVLLIAIDPIISPFRATINVSGSVAACALVSPVIFHKGTDPNLDDDDDDLDEDDNDLDVEAKVV
jgi:proton glutamate symport protein